MRSWRRLRSFNASHPKLSFRACFLGEKSAFAFTLRYWQFRSPATSLLISVRRIEKALDLIDSLAGVMVANVDEGTRVL